ncbi:PAC2 family protein [Enemella dayhoffiae]|uniref:PAC2 family protein n=1 Tax=Enemella dayhoffiae TaxID=2016507 RepID=A0A255H454_9ACTN|nr:PAC2 family protein [Enemella dayhoffiae]OYO22026.1 PAC2 family protein [Enemella dayhoffiae]
MLDPRLLYQFNPALWESMRGTRPVLVHLLEGYIDAGQVGRTLVRHLQDTCESEVLVEFDVDQLHDYRSRRPMMVFDTDQWRSAETFRLAMYRMTAPNGKVFVLLAGPEPDTQWVRAIEAVSGLAQRLDIRLAVTSQGIPMGVPHTRPSLITAYATDSALIVEDNPVWVGRVELPGSFGTMLELRLGELGVKALGLAVNVPHYLAQAPFPQAAIAALERINAATGLDLPLTGLPERRDTNLAEISTEMQGSEEVQQVVAQLEQQYDQAQAQTERHVPSADEIGAELERFLAEQDTKDKPNGEGGFGNRDLGDRDDPGRDRGDRDDNPGGRDRRDED